jgi:hypothetical protein
VFSSIGDHALDLVVRLGMVIQCSQLDSFIRGHEKPSLESGYHNIIVLIHLKIVLLCFFKQKRLDLDPNRGEHINMDSVGTGLSH